ncbi:ATP-binding cassette domain-containing protein [Epidermidibacterium keratini]|uniref:ATP-binding cassette domain-containing protein n=1 Tax=Epidermidibacterium keratini TaxID=1891644 RepID=A0A7L4YT58_9ACTN|nr:amino acid ABC transporter ATP-binding protein [Epidermidibacterium keratini]QHC02280.1 ATP-binding cassette domain-containing protein [Epidermidibacterium keratini]
MIDARGVHKSYGDHDVLRGIDLQIKPGSVTAILGPSGSGKSTLLRVINHLEKLDRGTIRVDGDLIGYRRKGQRLHELSEREILHQRSKIGFVFQNFNLFGHLTVLDNIIEAPISAQRRRRKEVEPLARDLLKRVGVADKANEYPRRLSGGQQQRVAIARALAIKPQLILFDEPTSALDPELVGEVLDVIAELSTSGVTLVIVTHEIGFARRISDTVIFMDQGQIIEGGPPDQVIDNPEHPRTRSFISKVL